MRSVKLIRFAFAAAAAVTLASASAADQPRTLDLADGYRFQLVGAGETQARVGNPKTIYVNVALTDDKIQADKKRLIEASDRVFESVLMSAAEKGYYKRAIVNIRRAGAIAFEEFLYVRGSNDVWLRQAGTEPWKVAQDPAAWTAPKSEQIQMDKLGAFAVEAAVEITPPAGFERAAEIDFVTKTPLIDIQRKFREVKALWARMDRDQMRKDGFDLVMFGNFAEPQKGRFHARKGFYVRIPRLANGEWAELPDRAPDSRDALVAKNERPADELVQQIAYTFTFPGPVETLRLSTFVIPAFAPTEAPVANVAFGFNTPAVKFEPATLLDLNGLGLKIQ